jgi:AraC-like DNA-binding protein
MKSNFMRGSHFFRNAGLALWIKEEITQKDSNFHAHEFHELVVVTGGYGVHKTEREEYPVEAGDIFLIRPALQHAYKKTEKLKLINILYQPRRLALPNLDLSDLPGYYAFFELEPKLWEERDYKGRLRLAEDELERVLKLTRLIQYELGKKEQGFGYMAVAYFMQLRGEISRAYTRKNEESSHAPLYNIGELLSYIDRKYAKNLSLEDLARKANMSSRTLIRTFQKAFNMTPVEYLIRHRIGKAASLFKEENLSVGEVSEMTGFADSNYFSRQFKKKTGFSPREYKKRYQNNL